MSKQAQQPPPGVPEWTQRDDTLLYTCHIGHVVHTSGDLATLAEVLSPFPPTMGPCERLWVSGPFALRDFQAPGDGSVPGSFLVGGGGVIGMGLMAGSLIGNAAARGRARHDSIPRWLVIDTGTLFVSRYGFYMATSGVFPWSWDSITSATMVGPGAVHFTGNSEGGPVSWILESLWAELVFILWALNRHPQHPQLVDGGWLPPGWVQHAAAHHRQLPPGLPGT